MDSANCSSLESTFTIPIKITTFFLKPCLKSCYFLCRSTSAIPSANTPAYADDDAAGSVGTATSAWFPAHHAAASRSAAGQWWYRRGCQSLWSAQMIGFWLYVMHSNKTGNKSHRPVLRCGQLKLAEGWKMTHLSFWDFCFVLFLFLFLFLFIYIFIFVVPQYVFYHLHVISDFSNIFLQKILHLLPNPKPVKSKTLGIGNFKGWFLKITLLEKPLKVLDANGHISKSRSMNLILVSN